MGKREQHAGMVTRNRPSRLIGSVMVPMLLRAGHSLCGYDSDLYRPCTFASGGEQVARSGWASSTTGGDVLRGRRRGPGLQAQSSRRAILGNVGTVLRRELRRNKS